jgi:SurA N-terminal domain
MHSKFISILFMLAMITTSLHAVVIDKIRAIVNDEVITDSELYAIEHLNLDLSGLPPRENWLQRRIDYKLILQQMKRQPPLEVPEEEFQIAVDTFAARHGGMEEVLVFLNKVGMNYADFEQELRNQLQIRAFIRIRFRPFVNIRLEEAEKYYNETYKPRLEKEGKPVPEFEEALDDVQTEMVESNVRERAKQWLDELRGSANITIKA